MWNENDATLQHPKMSKATNSGCFGTLLCQIGRVQFPSLQWFRIPNHTNSQKITLCLSAAAYTRKLCQKCFQLQRLHKRRSHFQTIRWTNVVTCTAPDWFEFWPHVNTSSSFTSNVCRPIVLRWVYFFGRFWVIYQFFFKWPKKLSLSGHNIRKYRLVIAVAVSFNTIMEQMTEMSQRNKQNQS